MTITAEQLRAARGLLKMEQRVLADASNVSIQTLKRYEGGSGPLTGNYENVSAIVGVLRDAGVTFLAPGDQSSDGLSVRLSDVVISALPYGGSGHLDTKTPGGGTSDGGG